MQSYGILNGAGADMEPVPDTNHFRVFTEMRAHMDSLKVTGKEPFRIVLEEAQGEIEEKKSRFIATIRPIETEEEALQESKRCLRCDHFGYGRFKGGRNREW